MGSAAEVLNTRSNLTDCITLNVSVSTIVYPLLDIASSMVVNKSCGFGLSLSGRKQEYFVTIEKRTQILHKQMKRIRRRKVQRLLLFLINS